jgi:deoxyribodipyrimidine photo-lyase
MIQSACPPTRADGLQRLADFVPYAGADYAAGRNSDPGPDKPSAVSKLSPYLRYRLISEQEVVAQVLARHNFQAAEKYLQEVLWRSYWKGWLEMRPAVWRRFLTERDQAQQSFPNMNALHAAESGCTGIEGFDDWARELVETGYLHNHARMWFASIWIFTLRLPWALGADFFLRHLLDADAASNTLSWRWVAGLQTAGKTYLATAENIARFTGGRFTPKGLARDAVALTEPPIEPPVTLLETGEIDHIKPSLLLVTHEDMHAESLFPKTLPIRGALITVDDSLLCGEKSQAFVQAAATDAFSRIKSHFGCDTDMAEALDADTLIAAAKSAGAAQIVTNYAPVGPVADALRQIAPALAREGLVLVQKRCAWDSSFWPHAQKGFFPFRGQIPHILSKLGMA